MAKHLGTTPERLCPLHGERRMDVERILVIVDPESPDRVCLQKAARLAAGCNASVELFACHSLHDYTAMERVDREERLLARLDAMATPLRDDGVDVITHCDTHAPREQGIGLRAIRSKPDVVMLAASDELDCLALIRAVAAPLLLVRAQPWPKKPRWTASIDPCQPTDRPASLDESLVSLAGHLAGAVDGTLDALHVLRNPPHLPGTKLSPSERASAYGAARDAAQDLLGRVSMRGVPIPLTLATGRVVNAIEQFVEAHAVDVLAVGAGARPRFDQPMGTSTAAQLYASLKCDLLVVRPPGFVSSLLTRDE